MKAIFLYGLLILAQLIGAAREHRTANTPSKNPFAGVSGRNKWRIKREILTKLWTGKNK